VAFVTNGAEWHISLRASLELGCAFAPLNPKTANNAAEARHLMEMLYLSVVLVQDSAVAKKLESIANVRVKLIISYFKDIKYYFSNNYNIKLIIP
jgi:acyl-CoA synthetase (AMP-forming)/AMP-acid ligase II